MIEDGLIFSKSFINLRAYPLYEFGANTHSVEKYNKCLKYAYITISFSYVYFKGLHRIMESSPA